MPYSDPEKKRAQDRAYYETNREKRLAYQKAFNDAHKEEIADYKRAYRADNADSERERKKAWRHANPDTVIAQQRAWKKDNPERYQDLQLKKYGITWEDYRQILDDQQGVCAICQIECSTGKNLAVDHCHETGEVRGLLCSNCNTAIGKFKDSTKNLQRAIDYLQRKDGPHRVLS